MFGFSQINSASLLCGFSSSKTFIKPFICSLLTILYTQLFRSKFTRKQNSSLVFNGQKLHRAPEFLSADAGCFNLLHFSPFYYYIILSANTAWLLHPAVVALRTFIKKKTELTPLEVIPNYKFVLSHMWIFTAFRVCCLYISLCQCLSCKSWKTTQCGIDNIQIAWWMLPKGYTEPSPSMKDTSRILPQQNSIAHKSLKNYHCIDSKLLAFLLLGTLQLYVFVYGHQGARQAVHIYCTWTLPCWLTPTSTHTHSEF